MSIATRCFAASGPAAATDVTMIVATSATSMACIAFMPTSVGELDVAMEGRGTGLAAGSQKARNRLLSGNCEAWLAR